MQSSFARVERRWCRATAYMKLGQLERAVEDWYVYGVSAHFASIHQRCCSVVRRSASTLLIRRRTSASACAYCSSSNQRRPLRAFRKLWRPAPTNSHRLLAILETSCARFSSRSHRKREPSTLRACWRRPYSRYDVQAAQTHSVGT